MENKDIIIEDSEVLLDEADGLSEKSESDELLSEKQTGEILSEKEVQPENEAIDNNVLKIKKGDYLVSEQGLIKTTLHELNNSMITGTILTGKIAGIERARDSIIAVLYYKNVKVIIPHQEMELPINPDDSEYLTKARKFLKLIVSAEIDFIVRGIDEESETAIGSRRLAMRRKRKNFYYPNDGGSALIEPGKLVQARIMTVWDKSMLIEAFGVQYHLSPNEVGHNFIANLRNNYQVGDKTVVRISKIKFVGDKVTIKADIKSTKEDTSLQKLLQLNLRSSYLGTITDIQFGKIYILLSSGVNAVAHTCLDVRTPSKGDEVSFMTNMLNRETRLAVGVVTKIVRQQIN